MTLIFGQLTAKLGHMTMNVGRTQGDDLFGNRVRTGVLVLLELMGESYPRELARLLSATLSSVQKAVNRLELEGVVASRMIGNARRLRLNPRFVAAAELRALLRRMAEFQPQYEKAAASVRRRPRRAGKPL